MKILIIVFLLIYNFYELSCFKVEKLILKSNKINNLKITQISDFHNNIFINERRLVKSIKKFNPDFIFITGDLISRNTKDFSKVENLLQNLSNFKIYFVEGNHERENINNKKFYNILDKYNVINLSGDFKRIENVNIYGNKFGTSYDYTSDLDLDFYNILLTHDPIDFLGNIKKYDLVLSGHKHGGQVRLPYIGQIIDHGPKFFPKYSKGLYNIEDINFYISSGLGQSICLRFLNRVSYTNIKIKNGG